MDRKNHFERYNSRFVVEAVIKSLLVGLAIGFGLTFIAATVTYIIDFGATWIMIAALVAGVAVSMPIFYFKVFRPTVISNARRIDRYGLEERLVTMVELENDESYLARIQREDAEAKLAEIQASEIKYKIPKIIIVFALVAGFLGLGMSTVNILAQYRIIPPFIEIWDDITPDPEIVYVEVTYMVYDGGTIEGDESQVIVLGGNTTEVIAVPDDGYAFVQWDDGSKRPTRSDSGITESIVYTAIFLPLSEDGQGEGEGEGEGDGEPGDKPGKGDGHSNSDGPEGPPSQGAGGQYLPSNQVINGETYYGSVFEEYYEGVLGEMTENVEMSNDVKDFIKNYFEIIQAADPDAEGSN